jgi:hypothetical protein
MGGERRQIGKPPRLRITWKRPRSTAIGLDEERMVRRGSTVRVRQRALQKTRQAGVLLGDPLRISQLDTGMEHSMEVPGQKAKKLPGGPTTFQSSSRPSALDPRGSRASIVEQSRPSHPASLSAPVCRVTPGAPVNLDRRPRVRQRGAEGMPVRANYPCDRDARGQAWRLSDEHTSWLSSVARWGSTFFSSRFTRAPRTIEIAQAEVSWVATSSSPSTICHCSRTVLSVKVQISSASTAPSGNSRSKSCT